MLSTNIFQYSRSEEICQVANQSIRKTQIANNMQCKSNIYINTPPKPQSTSVFFYSLSQHIAFVASIYDSKDDLECFEYHCQIACHYIIFILRDIQNQSQKVLFNKHILLFSLKRTNGTKERLINFCLFLSYRDGYIKYKAKIKS